MKRNRRATQYWRERLNKTRQAALEQLLNEVTALRPILSLTRAQGQAARPAPKADAEACGKEMQSAGDFLTIQGRKLVLSIGHCQT